MEHGDDVTQNDDFQKGNVGLQGAKFHQKIHMSSCHHHPRGRDPILPTQRICNGGDATENDDFQKGKQRLQGTIFYFGDEKNK